ncbi:CbtB domain-containing protein [Arthrobacter sp. B6]|uniref:CbtB domain-containing protein n=1 Tax=Arthrobacter sp. B6 TaxID=1570137 RepID=UPI0009ED4D71|nr:CbtB domain-containing protein [Arthrobacter sp. B6]
MTTIHPTQVRGGSGPLAVLGTLLALAVSVLVLYLVQFDNGQLSQAGMLLHELMHDGRHLLGVPCH